MRFYIGAFNVSLDIYTIFIKRQTDKTKSPLTCDNCSYALLPSLNKGEVKLRCPDCNSEQDVSKEDFFELMHEYGERN